MELSASEHVDSIAVAWNESYKAMQRFYTEHAVDKGNALAISNRWWCRHPNLEVKLRAGSIDLRAGIWTRRR